MRDKWVFICVKNQKKFTEKRVSKDKGVGIGFILSFSETVKKVQKKMAVTQGGSRIEFESAGFKDGNFASIKIENSYALTKE